MNFQNEKKYIIKKNWFYYFLEPGRHGNLQGYLDIYIIFIYV